MTSKYIHYSKVFRKWETHIEFSAGKTLDKGRNRGKKLLRESRKQARAASVKLGKGRRVPKHQNAPDWLNRVPG